ncbi:MAG TPA: YedE family putative selenium transporter [Spirochaetota bacterium]|nr:YedE family putative selenium transporter [Spirochaetota bacterium]HSA14522.1 YedE family putative selenium transporter [Spirochaetota bacterium]
MKNIFASRIGIIVVGAVIGALAPLLQYLGNPKNMGICVACFERDIAGAIGLHRADVVQYLRPEIMGFVLGSFLIAMATREYKPRAGSSTVIRFFLGVFAMIGALVFLGCPWRALLRLAGGDGNAITGLLGLIAGITVGVLFLKNGYSLGRSYANKKAAGWVFPAFMLALFLFLVFNVSFSEGGPIFFSQKGPGSMHANMWVSLGAGLFIGGIAQKSRFCTMGALRDIILARDIHLASGVLALLIMAFLMNYFVFAQFNAGFESQPVAHTAHVWNFLGMTLAGLAFALAGGCPGRQLIMAGEGDADSGIFVLGMIVGAGLAHNFSLAAKPDAVVEEVYKIGGIGMYGQAAVIIGLIFCLIIGFTMREKMQA